MGEEAEEVGAAFRTLHAHPVMQPSHGTPPRAPTSAECKRTQRAKQGDEGRAREQPLNTAAHATRRTDAAVRALEKPLDVAGHRRKRQLDSATETEDGRQGRLSAQAEKRRCARAERASASAEILRPHTPVGFLRVLPFSEDTSNLTSPAKRKNSTPDVDHEERCKRPCLQVFGERGRLSVDVDADNVGSSQPKSEECDSQQLGSVFSIFSNDSRHDDDEHVRMVVPTTIPLGDDGRPTRNPARSSDVRGSQRLRTAVAETVAFQDIVDGIVTVGDRLRSGSFDSST